MDHSYLPSLPGLPAEIRMYEEMCLNGHVALNTFLYDGWLLKFSEGYTGRANSVSLLYPSSKPVEQKIEFCEECYKKQGLPCQFKLTDFDKAISELLEKRGYQIVTPSDLMICNLNKADIQAAAEPSIEYVFYTTPEEWLPVYYKVHEINDLHDQDVYNRMVAKVLSETIYCTLFFEGQPAACASAVIENGYMLLQNVIVDKQLRGKGLGKKVCTALLAKAKENGAHNSFLQVVQTNTPAVNLYKKLGFEKLYSYWYMKK